MPNRESASFLKFFSFPQGASIYSGQLWEIDSNEMLGELTPFKVERQWMLET